MKLIIQIPCLNEAQTLEIALNDLPKHIDGIDEIEILIINDGSVDNTVEVARNWGVNYVVSFTKNKGLAKGFMAGIEAALSYGADIIVNTDADNQYAGADIEKLVDMIECSEKPLLICGGGVVRSQANMEFEEFANRIDSPVAVTVMGGGGFHGRNELTTGMIGMHGSQASNMAVKCV